MQVTVRDDGAVLEGTVVGVHSAATSGTTARLRPEALTVYLVPAADSTGQFQSVWVGADGHFATQQVAPGTYRAFALDHQDPDLQFASEEALARFASQTQTIEVAAWQKTSFHLSLIRKAP